MKKHVMAITYAPKEAAVQSGECCQTIRKGDKVSVGDEILFHGWSSRPYRSPWSWQKRITVRDVMQTQIKYDLGIKLHGGWAKWSSLIVNTVAAADYISSATGLELRDVLFGHNSRNVTASTYQIIRW